MRARVISAACLLSLTAYSACAISASEDYYAAYSIESVAGDMPIRNVVVKRVGEYFTSYLGFQFDCTNQTLSQTGFFSSPESVLRELARTKPSDGSYSFMTDRARAKACDIDTSETVSDAAQHPKTT
ncbi:hypothetical protein [Pseudomonas sp. NPDC096950]|uniref:hypothetical protein n=1 Tax=Pseudomonas sp. NPDC096950 TaxID=3364485 RepID=UPI00383AA145